MLSRIRAKVSRKKPERATDSAAPGATMTERVLAYVDGFNLYYGLKSKG